MRLVIELYLENAAFEDFNGCNGCEAARILRQLANDIKDDHLTPDFTAALRDLNGNSVGTAEVRA